MYISISVVLVLFGLVTINASPWPIPYKRYSKRPVNDPYCSALYSFCPTGLSANTMPKFDGDDTIDVFALKAPVWEFKFGDLLKHFNIMHDAIGFRSHKTGINYTMEWYELDQLLNCTFPHVVGGKKEMIWCNQGAACVFQGIDDKHWKENGSLIKVAEMSGHQFANYSDWALWDNKTGIFYETWSVLDKPGGQHWFYSHDCATFVLNTFQKLAEVGVKFNKTVNLKYTRINLYSETPFRLGNYSYIKKTKPYVHKDLLNFYSKLQPHLSVVKTIENLSKFFIETLLFRKFYFFYNYEYWQLHLKFPFIKLVYETIPLP